MSVGALGQSILTLAVERRIQAVLHGPQYFDFSSIIGWKAFKESVELFGADHEFTKLVIDLKGKDPDDAFSSIPYEKGFNFLYYLDRLVGREKWDKFIPYVSTQIPQTTSIALIASSTFRSSIRSL
jgi:leukotriene-A4 hydrolase